MTLREQPARGLECTPEPQRPSRRRPTPPRWEPGASFYRALVFAVGLHADQARKNTSHDPYLAHILTVASLVVEDGGSEIEAIAALLHDAAEDRGGKARLDQIRSDFGDQVASIVEGCSDSLAERKEEKGDWCARKKAYIERLRTEEPAVRRVSLADKLHNARCTVTDLEAGRTLGDVFNAGPDNQRWYYAALLQCFEDAATKSRHLPEFRRLVARITDTQAPAALDAGTPTRR